MAIITSKKLNEMSGRELDEKLRELKLELSRETASSEIGGTVKSPGRIKEIRKTIARILTIKNIRNKRGGLK